MFLSMTLKMVQMSAPHDMGGCGRVFSGQQWSVPIMQNRTGTRCGRRVHGDGPSPLFHLPWARCASGCSVLGKRQQVTKVDSWLGCRYVCLLCDPGTLGIFLFISFDFCFLKESYMET